jgi:alcohol dehydrogenase class IV
MIEGEVVDEGAWLQMKPFEYVALPSRVLFGAGYLDCVAAEVEALGGRRAFLIHDPTSEGNAAKVAAALAGKADVKLWGQVVQHVPIDLAEPARKAVDEHGSDLVISIGGGSSTGLAKAIALSHGLPILAVPTTYAGSEMTTIYGLTGDRHKQTGKSPQVLPKTVVYDPLLTLGLPANVTGPSAFNSLAHCVEALYAQGHNPVASAIALEGVRAISESLPRVMRQMDDVEARGDLLYGAMLGGMSLGATASGFHHRLCHILGGKFNLIHADTHSVILPHAVAFNARALPAEMRRLAGALGVPGGDPAAALWDLAKTSGIPTDLASLGLPREGLEEVAAEVVAEEKHNPVPLDEASVMALLNAAYDGIRPSATASV